MDFPPQLQSLLGLGVFVSIAWALSENRKAFPVTTVIVGIGLQILLAAALLGLPFMRDALLALNGAVDAIQAATARGSSFVFGYVGGGAAPFTVSNPNAVVTMAFTVLPIVIVMSALSAVLWHWGILSLVVRGFAFALERTMKIGGALGLGCASNIFLGMIEAPLLIKPYLERLTRSELFTLFTCGLANVAGTVLVLYATVLGPVVPGAVGHIIVASLLSLPASIVLAKIMIPGTETTPATAGGASLYRSSMDAVSTGAEDGMKIYLSILAMLVAMISLVALANIVIGNVELGGVPLSFERIVGWIFAPIAWLMGVPWHEAMTVGSLLGVKSVLNEFIAFIQLSSMPVNSLSEHSRLITIYALAGFANLASIGIQISGIGTMAPERRKDLADLAWPAFVAATLGSCMTGCVVGIVAA